jgi:ATP-binding cassette subfamily B protein RaxB
MKNPLDKIGWFDKLGEVPTVLQTEVAECGLACLTMIARYHGKGAGLRAMRQRFPQTLRGMSIDQLVKSARSIGFSARALRLELEHLPDLKFPCILHWGMSHFVVLTKVRHTEIIVIDPAAGRRRIRIADVDRLFTGVAVELQTTADFQPEARTPALKLRQLWSHAPGLTAALVKVFMVSMLIQALALLAPFQLQLTLDEALPTADRSLLTTLLVALIGLLIVQTAVSALRGLLILHVSNTVAYQVASNLFAHLLRLPVEFFERRHAGDVASRFLSLDRIRETLTVTFVEAIVDGLLVFGTLTAMMLYSPMLGAIAACGLIAYGLVKWLTHGPLRRATDEQISANAQKDTSFLESVRGMASIRQFGGEAERHGLWQNALAASLNAGTRVGKISVGQAAASQIATTLDGILIIYFGAFAILSGEMTVGVLTAVLAYRTQFSQRGAALIDKIQILGLVRLHLERVSDIALTTPAAPAGMGEFSGDQEQRGEGRVEIQALEYRYGPFERPVLSGLNLNVAPGESVAIVGASGNGKSTLLKCLVGLAEPTGGQILIDGRAVSARAGHRGIVGSVLQGDVLFAGTVADNIGFFGPALDRQRMVEVARWVGLHHVIERLPMGYETTVGDIGKSLSAGQQQRLLIARALYRGPSVLVLDEATSQLDVLAERFINDNLSRLKITRISVAHRPETILASDRFYVLEDGILAELPRDTMVEMLDRMRGDRADSESRADRVRIPRQAGHPFHGKPVTDSTPSRSPIPRQAGRGIGG